MIEQNIVRTGFGIELPVYSLNTVIVGAGAAGVNCAIHLYEFMLHAGVSEPQDRIVVLAADRRGGASRLSGSDKQTYYKMGTSPRVPDSAYDFASTLTAHGCAHGDVALVEALGSLREFYHLVQLGVPFPHDPEGAYIGYKTDHDANERATSAGPKTSAYMCECLDRQAEHYGIRMLDGHEAAHLLVADGDGARRIVGAVTIDRNRVDDPDFGLTVFLCENLVLAGGGPGELYATSVYPHGQAGFHGLALAAGLKAHNLTESQFGLASTKFRWNVSGTYMQVVPRVFSTDADGGDERDFLTPYFDTTAAMATNIFLKGYQWPFDPQRVVGQQSSLIDVLVYQETQIRQRRVFLDFRTNPVHGEGKEPFDLAGMDAEAFEYLSRNSAMQNTPIERLEHMNPLATEIYLEHGIDIRREPLEVSVCAQHNNGGFVVDKWWQSNIPGVFVIGEMAGTHGVKRPGGSALNSGQVGGLRAAECIVHRYGCDVAGQGQWDAVADQVESVHQWMCGVLSNRSGTGVDEAQRQIQSSMSRHAAHMRRIGECKEALEKAVILYKAIQHRGLCAVERDELPDAVRVRHLSLAQLAFLQSIVTYLEAGGGSRGSFLVLEDTGDVVHPDILDPGTGMPLAFRSENVELRDRIAVLAADSLADGTFGVEWTPVRGIPQRDVPFEVAWRSYRSGDVFKQSE